MPDDPVTNLQNQIKTAQAKQSPPAPTPADDSMSIGYRAGGELIGGIIGGLLFGYLIDRTFASGPFGLVIGAILGITAGFYGVYRATKS